MARNPHVLSVGVDLAPALQSNGIDADEVVNTIANACLRGHGEAAIPAAALQAIQAVAKVLNICLAGGCDEESGVHHLPAHGPL